jgi:hypothetical protein
VPVSEDCIAKGWLWLAMRTTVECAVLGTVLLLSWWRGLVLDEEVPLVPGALEKRVFVWVQTLPCWGKSL